MRPDAPRTFDVDDACDRNPLARTPPSIQVVKEIFHRFSLPDETV